MIPELTFVTPLRIDSWQRERNWNVVQRNFQGIPANWIVSSPEDFTIASARNAGIKEVQTKHLCIIDADILMKPKEFIQAYEQFVSGEYDIYSPCNVVIRASSANTKIASQRNDYIRWSYLSRIKGNSKRAANVCGGIVFMTKDAAIRLGGYDERFTTWGYEDVALDNHARKLGMKMGRHNAWCFHLYHPARRIRNNKNLFITEYKRKTAEEITVRKSRVPINRIEYHVTDTCNLHCMQCSHYSNFTTKGTRLVEDVRAELEPWASKILPERVCLLGGEPTINPDLVPILYAVRELFPLSGMMLVSNGFFLERHPELPKAIVELGIDFQISKHHESDEYNQRFEQVTRVLNQWSQENAGFKFNIRRSIRKWVQQYELREDGKAYPIRSRPTYAWKACVQKYCHQIYQGKLWKCPAIAYFRNLESKLGLEEIPDWNRFRDYKPLDPDCTIADLQNFVTEKAISACGLCPQNLRKIPIQNPMHLPILHNR